MPDAVRVGTCGYRWFDPPEGWKDEYDSTLEAFSADPAFDLVEINSTFYSLPQVSTTERWCREAREGFEFAVKAWQALTHEWSSPTWNGQRDDVEDDDDLDSDEVGSLRPNETVREAWNRTAARAEALEAAVVLLQTPASFDATDEHETNVRELLGDLDRDGFTLAWEPRGDWLDDPDRVAAICDDLDLVHVVDLMRDDPISSHPTSYVRLHGLNEDRYDYDYDYSEEELEALLGKVEGLLDDHETVSVLFNNHEKFANARAFQDLLEGR